MKYYIIFLQNDIRIAPRKGSVLIFMFLQLITTAEEAMNPETAKNNIADTTEQVFRLFYLMRNEVLD